MSDATSPGGSGAVTIERTYRAALRDVWELWTTKAGFESWWGPQGFRAEVHEIDPRVGGALHYDMVAATPEMIAAMQRMGQPVSHPTRARFTEVQPLARLVITNVIDFIPGVPAYESVIGVTLTQVGDRVNMTVTLHPLHSAEFTAMQIEGFTSQLTKLDARWP